MRLWRVLTEDRNAPPLGTASVIARRVLDSGLVEWIVEGPTEMEAISMYCPAVLSVEPVEGEGRVTKLESANQDRSRIA